MDSHDIEIREPDVKDFSYGPHERNRFDLWQASSDVPTPLLIYVHGGGFTGGDRDMFKERAPYLFAGCLQSGISFAAINYRLSQMALYPASMHDAARAVQTLRANAEEWRLDPTRFAATGNSAGAGISLWLAFHKDMADPESDEVPSRQSTRLSCALPTHAQCTYDPREVRKIVPGEAYDNVALKLFHGLSEDFNWDADPIDEHLDAMLRDCSPITHLDKDAPPVFVCHYQNQDVPGNIHHANFGRHLKNEMETLGIECVRRMDSDYPDEKALQQDMLAFLKQHFGM